MRYSKENHHSQITPRASARLGCPPKRVNGVAPVKSDSGGELK
jgi:hypothetical protein